MKIQKLNENMPNLDKVVHNDDLNAVTEMPPTMSDAYIDSVEADKAVEDIIKPAKEIIKEKPFLGAEKQPTPKEPEEAKITLDESLFDDDSPLTDPYDGNYSLQEQIFDFLDHSDSFDTAEMVELVSDEFGMSPDEAEGYVQDWITNSDTEWHDTADQEDASIDSLKDYVDSIEVEEDVDFDESLNESDLAANDLGSYKDQLKIIRQIDKAIPYSLRYKEANFIEDDGYTYLYWVAQEPFTKSELEHFQDSVNDILDRYYDFDIVPQTKLTVRDVSKGYKTDKLNNQLISIDRYGYIENDDWYWKKYSDYLDENLNEEDKSKLSWDELGTEEAEDVDLWTLVYNTLSKERDLGASNSIKKYVTPQLSLKQRYDPINSDSDGNIVIYGETEEEFNPAKEVADFHNLKYKIKESPKNWIMKHPEQKYTFTIIIPEDQLNRKLELRNPDVKRGRPKKIKEKE